MTSEFQRQLSAAKRLRVAFDTGFEAGRAPTMTRERAWELFVQGYLDRLRARQELDS